MAVQLDDDTTAQRDRIVIDCGVTFPGRTHGVDLIHPKLDWLFEQPQSLRAIVLTHGHEDHIGGIPYLLAGLPNVVPIYGPPYALALVRRRLGEFNDLELPEMIPTRPEERFAIGGFDIEPVRVNHSIPDCTSLIVRTAAGTFIHTGDFKIEEEPLDGEAFGADALRRVAAEGVDLLMSDSTNIDVPGDTGEEHEVAATLSQLMKDAPHRFLVGQFASNVYRMKALFAAAREHGRKVCLLGRSVNTHSEVSRKLGILDSVADLIVPPDHVQKIPRRELCVIATGTQGEHRSALGRLSRGEHQHLSLDEGDTLVMSSRIIPGCEKSVFAMLDGLERQGVTIIHRKHEPGVHVSGHAARDEQSQYIQLTQPKAFVPLHGTFHHMQAHAALADSLGVAHTLVAENGDVLQLDADGLKRVDRIEPGRVHVERGQAMDAVQLKERRLLGELGHAVVAFVVDGGQVRQSPEVAARGLVREDLEDEVLDEAARYVHSALQQSNDRDLESLEGVAARALKRFLGKSLGRKPLVTAIGMNLR